MDSLETSQDALNFLKSKRVEDTDSGTPEASAEEMAEEVEAEEVETEEAELDEQLETEEDGEESLFVEIDGKEISLDEIRESLGSKFRQSDYTRKTQELAEERKLVEAAKAKADEAQKQFDTRMAELEGLLVEQENSINWDELLEDDPATYLREKQKLAKKEKALEEARAVRQKELDAQRLEYLNAQVIKMKELLPEWVDDTGKFTPTMEGRIPVINQYLEAKGFSVDDVNQVTDARLWAVFEDAANYRAIKSKKPAVDKELKRAPKVLKPKKGRKKPTTSISDEARQKFKQSGSEKDALSYLKARRT